MKKSVVSVLGVFLVILAVTPVQSASFNPSENVELELGLSKFDFEGDVEVTDDGVAGSDISVESQLDLAEDESLLVGLDWQFADNWGLSLGYNDYSFTGKNTLNQQITYAGDTFTNSTDINSTFDMGFWDADVSYRVTETPNKSYLDFFLGARIIDFDGKIESSDTTATESFTGGVPVVGTKFRWDADQLADGLFFDGEASGLDISVTDADFQLIDWTASVNYAPSSSWYLKAGYRGYQIDGDYDNPDGNEGGSLAVDFSGPRASVGMRF